MDTNKKLGICMDESSSHLIHFVPTNTKTSKHSSGELAKEVTICRQNNINVELSKHPLNPLQYYETLSKAICGCSEVILFGAAETKMELMDLLLGDIRFAEVKIDLRRTCKMELQEKLHFVDNYFSER